MMRYMKKGNDLLCVDSKYDNLNQDQVLSVLGAEAVFEMYAPIKVGPLIHMILTCGYLGVSFWRPEQLQMFFGLTWGDFIDTMQNNGWTIYPTKTGYQVFNIEHPDIHHSDHNALYAIITALKKLNDVYGREGSNQS